MNVARQLRKAPLLPPYQKPRSCLRAGKSRASQQYMATHAGVWNVAMCSSEGPRASFFIASNVRLCPSRHTRPAHWSARRGLKSQDAGAAPLCSNKQVLQQAYYVMLEHQRAGEQRPAHQSACQRRRAAMRLSCTPHSLWQPLRGTPCPALAQACTHQQPYSTPNPPSEVGSVAPSLAQLRPAVTPPQGGLSWGVHAAGRRQ